MTTRKTKKEEKGLSGKNCLEIGPGPEQNLNRAAIEAATESSTASEGTNVETGTDANRATRERRFIFEKWCKGCAICVEFCPKKVLEMSPEGKPYAKNPEACVYCGLCELRCPDLAISVHDIHKVPEGGDE